MKVLVTGGAGFIGSHLAERLLAQGDEVAILDGFTNYYRRSIKDWNLAQVRRRGEFLLFEEDLVDRDGLEMAFGAFRPEAVVHLAAWAGVRPSLENPVLYSDVNVTGTTNLLEVARRYPIENFIFGSSSSVYGVNSKAPFHEDDPLNRPISPYAATKRAGELICYTYHHNYRLPVTCLRFFTVYGPRQRPEMAIHKFTRMIDAGEEIPVYHEGKSERDYTHINDILEGVLAALRKPRPFEIFNLGNSRTVPLMDLIQLIEKALGKEAKIRLLPAQLGDVPITYADISRASEQLGYEPTIDIVNGVEKFVKWYRGWELRTRM